MSGVCVTPPAPIYIRARIYKRLGSPGIDSQESIPPGWESILGLLKMFTNSGSEFSIDTVFKDGVDAFSSNKDIFFMYSVYSCFIYSG